MTRVWIAMAQNILAAPADYCHNCVTFFDKRRAGLQARRKAPAPPCRAQES
jgi:hypothetical protein